MPHSEDLAPQASSILPMPHSAVRTLAVFRALRLGDMLCAVPALRALRSAFPHAHVTLIGLPWAEQFASRFRAYIDDFVPFPGHPAFPEQPARTERIDDFYREMRERHVDLALQMHGDGSISNGIVRQFGAAATAGFTPAGGTARDGIFIDYPDRGPEPVRLLRLAFRLGATAAMPDLEFPIGIEDERELHDAGLAADMLPRHYICIHPGASVPGKCWPPHRFAEIGDRLSGESGLPVVLTGSGKERELAENVAAKMRTPAINAAAPISIGAMAALMSRARLLVCNDTGVSHIAAALKLPSVVIFSVANMDRWAPLDRSLHRCLWDPGGERMAAVLRHARELIGRL